MTAEPIRLNPDAASRPAGFSLVELLVALTVCALLSGAMAAVAPQARTAFEATPEALDLQQRERTAAGALARALRSAALITATRDDGSPGEALPGVTLLDPDDDGVRFHAFRVMAVAGQGRGVLDVDQASPSGSLKLTPDVDCPSAGDVCGFSKGASAIVAGVDSRFDVFTVASTNNGTHALIASRAFGAAYPAGSVVMEVSADTYRLDPQADGSSTLVRETAAGAVQPIVDDVSELSIEEWRPGDVLKRLDLAVRLGARSALPRRRVPGRTLHLSVSLRNPS